MANDASKDGKNVVLSGRDVERLLHEPSAVNRSDIVSKIAREFSAQSLNDRERQIATQIFRLLLNDVETMVRRALSEALRASPAVPHDIAMALARDLNEVAVPLLESSDVLNESDLIEIVRNPIGAKLVSDDDDPDLMMVRHDPADGTPKQVAVAKRPVVPARLSAALVENGNEKVAETLIRNEGAEIPDPVAHRVVDRFGESEPVQAALVDRSQLPITVMERVACLVSDELRKKLTKRRSLPADLANRLAVLAQEKTTLELLRQHRGPKDLEKLIQQLWREQRLTPTLILRAACVGEIGFFEAALARRGNQAVETMRDLLYGSDDMRFSQIFHMSAIPANLHKALRAAIEMLADLRDENENDREGFIAAMISGILAKFGDDPNSGNWHNLGAHDLEYALARMSAVGQ